MAGPRLDAVQQGGRLQIRRRQHWGRQPGPKLVAGIEAGGSTAVGRRCVRNGGAGSGRSRSPGSGDATKQGSTQAGHCCPAWHTVRAFPDGFHRKTLSEGSDNFGSYPHRPGCRLKRST